LSVDERRVAWGITLTERGICIYHHYLKDDELTLHEALEKLVDDAFKEKK